MGEHSIIPPSSAGIWGKPDGCTGWVSMAQMHPEPTEGNEAAEAGTASHEIGEELIRRATGVATNIIPGVGDLASNGVPVTIEMVEGAELYAEDVAAELKARWVKGGVSYGVEDKIQAPRIHALSFGTGDAWLYDPHDRELFIWDYKYGHLPVEVFENWQGINYAAGLFDSLGIGGQLDQVTTVRFRIVQPRAFHPDGPIREWAVKASDLRGHINILASNAKTALSANARLQTGSHCRYCQARHACPEALNVGVSLFEMSAVPAPIALDPAQLGMLLSIITRASEQIKALKSGYEEQIKALQKSGVVVPGWGLEPVQGKVQWNKPLEEVLALGTMMGHDLRQKKAITPTQAKQLGIDEAVIMAYSGRNNTGLKLVRDTGSKAKQIFS